MSTKWYYKRGLDVHGPVSSAQLKALADSGKLLPVHLVCKAGMEQWAEASKVQGLFPTPPDDIPLANEPLPELPPHQAVVERRIAELRANGFVEVAEDLEFCCYIFQDAVSNQGQSGLCIVLGRLADGHFLSEIEFRAWPRFDKTNSVKGAVTTYTCQPIQYCPWCGVELGAFYGTMALPTVELMRQD